MDDRARKLESYEVVHNLEAFNENLHRAYLVLGYGVHDFDRAIDLLRNQVLPAGGIGQLKAAERVQGEKVLNGLYVATTGLKEYIEVMTSVSKTLGH